MDNSSLFIPSPAEGRSGCSTAQLPWLQLHERLPRSLRVGRFPVLLGISRGMELLGHMTTPHLVFWGCKLFSSAARDYVRLRPQGRYLKISLEFNRKEKCGSSGRHKLSNLRIHPVKCNFQQITAFHISTEKQHRQPVGEPDDKRVPKKVQPTVSRTAGSGVRNFYVAGVVKFFFFETQGNNQKLHQRYHKPFLRLRKHSTLVYYAMKFINKVAQLRRQAKFWMEVGSSIAPILNPSPKQKKQQQRD